MSEEQAVAEPKKYERHVEYGLQVFEELPPQGTGGGGRTSPFDDKMESIAGDTGLHGKPVCVAKYKNRTAAAAAANVLRQRHGSTPDAKGWQFPVRKVQDNGEVKHGLFFIYDPKLVKKGAWEQHVAKEEKRKADLEAKRAAAKAEKAKAK